MKPLRKLSLTIFMSLWVLVAVVTAGQIGQYHLLDDDVTMDEVTFEEWLQQIVIYFFLFLFIGWYISIEEDKDKKT